MSLFALVEGLIRDVDGLKNRVNGMIREGTVDEVDAKKGYRLHWGEDETGAPVLSPWMPHPESGGAFSTWAPLSKGQVAGTLHPAGDPRRGFIIRGGFSGENKPPSEKLDENVFKFGEATARLTKDALEMTIGGAALTFGKDSFKVEMGGATFEMNKDGATIKAGGAEFKLTGDGFAQTGGDIKHDGAAVGASHSHIGVMNGPGFTGPPKR